MLRTALLIAVSLPAIGLAPADRVFAQAPTVEASRAVLNEIMAIPIKQIPQSMLENAEGVAIVPGVVKIGLVAGVRRGKGVLVVRDDQGVWQPPSFITLTGGSVGWQAGVQSSDVVLVFKTRKSIDGIMRGKFTIGADASVAAGPVGREASAGTDARLQAEIYSYSRTRGLFVGVSLDGSVLQTDPADDRAYYQTAPAGSLPPSAVQLLESLNRYSAGRQQLVGAPAGPLSPVVAPGQPLVEEPRVALSPPGLAVPLAVGSPNIEAARKQLSETSLAMYGLLDEQWQRYLALPREVFTDSAVAPAAGIQLAQQHFEAVAGDPQFRVLADRPEFKAAHQALNNYAQEITPAKPRALLLPPPPAGAEFAPPAGGVTPPPGVRC